MGTSEHLFIYTQSMCRANLTIGCKVKGVGLKIPTKEVKLKSRPNAFYAWPAFGRISNLLMLEALFYRLLTYLLRQDIHGLADVLLACLQMLLRFRQMTF